MLLLFIPIGILVDLSEKIDKLKEFDVPFNEIVDYYSNFIWYFGNTLYPIFVFLINFVKKRYEKLDINNN